MLVVEDEFLIRELIKEDLEDAGYEVIAAADGKEAFAHLDNNQDRLTCLMTDYHLPGDLNGSHIIEYARGFYPQIPIILASAWPHATTLNWRMRHNVQMLNKPYYTEQILKLLVSY